MAHWAKPGIKCILVGYKKPAHWPNVDNYKGYDNIPKKGGIYTISGVHYREPYGVFLSLDGWPHDHWFIAAAFRPLDDHDIAKFTHLLNTTDEVVDA